MTDFEKWQAISAIYERADGLIKKGWMCCGKCLSLGRERIKQIREQAESQINQIAKEK